MLTTVVFLDASSTLNNFVKRCLVCRSLAKISFIFIVSLVLSLLAVIWPATAVQLTQNNCVELWFNLSSSALICRTSAKCLNYLSQELLNSNHDDINFKKCFYLALSPLLTIAGRSQLFIQLCLRHHLQILVLHLPSEVRMHSLWN